MPDVLVVGGGLAGMTVAHRLSELGVSVCVLEGRSGVGEGASFANGAMLTPSMADPWNAPGVLSVLTRSLFNPQSAMKLRVKALPSLAGWGTRFLRNSTAVRHGEATQRILQLARYSLGEAQRFRLSFGGEYDAVACGTLKVFREAGAFEVSKAIADRMSAGGLRYELLEPDGAVALEPQLAGIAGRIAGAIHYPDDEVGDAYKFCQALAKRIGAAGGDILADCEVFGLHVEGGHVRGVETAEGYFPADTVVLALGADHMGIAARAGVRMSIAPVKGYSITYDMGGLNVAPKIPVIDEALHAAVVPVGNRLRVVGTAEFTGHDDRLTLSRIANLEKLLAAVYPGLVDVVARRKGQPLGGISPDECRWRTLHRTDQDRRSLGQYGAWPSWMDACGGLCSSAGGFDDGTRTWRCARDCRPTGMIGVVRH